MKYFLIAIFFLATAAIAQDGITDSLDQIIKQVAPSISYETPGFSTLVSYEGQWIYSKMTGSANLENSIPIQSHTRFNIGSVSKQFTAFLILLLEDEGKLLLEDDVRIYLPDNKIFNTYTIKIKHLLYHTSGLREPLTMLQLCGWKDDDVYTSEDIDYLLTRQSNVNFLPGTMHQYSNLNYYVLARIIEKISGKTYSEYCREKIFVPLGMNSAIVVNDHKSILTNVADAYKSMANPVKYRPADDWYGHSNIYCTVTDLQKWADNLLQRKIGSPQVHEKFLSRGSFDNGKQISGDGYGLFHGIYRGIRYIGHDGSRLGFRADFTYYPEKKSYIITLSNARDFPYTDIRERFTNFLFKDQLSISPEQPVTVPSLRSHSQQTEDLEKYIGLYWDKIGDQTFKISQKNGILYADDYSLVPEDENLFRLKDEERLTASQVKFERVKGKERFQMKFIRGREVPFKSDNIFPFEWVDSTRNQSLSEFKGRFLSEELDLTVAVTQQGDSLLLRIRGFDQPISLQCAFADYFTDPDFGSLQFTRNKKKEIIGFSFFNAKANNIFFRKIIYRN